MFKKLLLFISLFSPLTLFSVQSENKDVMAVVPDEEFQPSVVGGFDDQTNGFTSQETFNDDKAEFEDIETAATGLGPVFNSDSCVSCHNHPVSGGGSVITELRAGHFDG